MRRVCLLLLVLAGCAAEDTTPGFNRLGVTPGVDAMPGTFLREPVNGEWVYRITSGDGAGGTTTLRRSATTEHGAQWVDDLGAHRSEYWLIDDDDNIVMPVVIEHTRKALTHFDPPLIIAPAQLMPGEPFEQEVNMRVMDLDRPERLKYAGTAVRTMRYVDNHLLQTPLGRLSTRRVEITFEAKLKMAGAETKTTLYVLDGYGELVAHLDETHRVMKVPVRSGEQWLVMQTYLTAPQSN